MKLETVVYVRCPSCQFLNPVPRAGITGLACQECRVVTALVPTKPVPSGPSLAQASSAGDLVISCDKQWFIDTYGDWWEFWWYASGCIGSAG